MKIIVNDIAASSGGALSILRSFYNHVNNSKLGKEHEWIFLLNNKYFVETENTKVIVLDDVKKNWLNRLKFDLFQGKKIITELNPDVVFSLQNTITFGLKCTQVVYMHQSIPFQTEKTFSFFNPAERKLAVYQHLIGRLIRLSVKKADKTIVQTEWVKKAIIKSSNVESNKIKVVFPEQDNISKFRIENVFKENSFFYPAHNEIYKNHQCIYEACEILKNKSIRDFNILLTLVEEKEIENITFCGTIPFEEVLEYYNRSTLIFPSYIETIGLPLIEARNIGSIILAADCPYSREALDGYINAYFFNPFKPIELADLMERVIKGEIKRRNVEMNEFISYSNSWDNLLKEILDMENNKKNYERN